MTAPLTRRLDRRRLIALLAALPAAVATPALAESAAAAEAPERVTGDVVLGAEDAPVTVIEYASLTCPHCASFHIDTWPRVKAEYVETGKVRFIMREVYFDAFGLWASMIARCGGEAGFYPMIDQFLTQQREWSGAQDPTPEIMKIGRINGLSAEEMRACLSDESYAKTLLANYQANAEEHGIQSTPSFIINGEMHRGAMGFEEFSSLIEAHL